jgi:hypothetical protein
MPAPRRTPKLRLAAWATALVALVLFAAGWPEARARAQEVYDEDSVKAAFLYHFSTFVVWPEPGRAGRDFVIAVLGDDEISGELERYLPGHSIQGRPMLARRLDSIEDLDDVDVVFIGEGRNHALNEDIEAIGNRPVLVVTDAEGALARGSMINFRIVEQRVRFEISLPAAERAGLVLSSRLLAAAMLVDTTTAILDPPAGTIVSGGPGISRRCRTRHCGGTARRHLPEL